MRTDGVVVLPPGFDQDLRFPKRVENLPVEQLVPQFAIEAFIVAVLPRTSRFDEERLDADLVEPASQSLGDKLRAVVRSYVFGRAVDKHRIGYRVKDIV